MRKFLIPLVLLLATSCSQVAPVNEDVFVETVQQFGQDYATEISQNEILAVALRRKRADTLCEMFPGYSIFSNKHIINWHGTVESISVNNDGEVSLSINIGEKVTIRTEYGWFSSTKIEPSASFYNVLSSIKSGQAIQFSGTFQSSSEDCLQENSITLRGGMTDPEFIFKFDNIQLVQTESVQQPQQNSAVESVETRIPYIKSGTPYDITRNILITNGYTFIPNQGDVRERCGFRTEVCVAYPETESCAFGTGRGFCGFTWADAKGQKVKVITYGEDLTELVVDSIYMY
jgi:hypothetical protein